MKSYFGDWEVRVHNSPAYMKNIIFMFRRMPHGVEFLTHDNVLVTTKEGDRTDENWFAEMDDEQLQELANAIAKHGVRTTNDSKNEGLLEATNKHLEDMRSIVFKGKQS